MTNPTAASPVKLPNFQNVSVDEIRHCKIIGTLGPSSSDEKTLRALINAGLNIARLNFSHRNGFIT